MKRLGWITLFIFAALAVSPGVAFAHGGEKHDSEVVLGTVNTVEKDKVEIETPDGKMVEVALNADTEYKRDDEDVTREALRPGMRVAMTVAKDEHGTMVCHQMKLGAMMEGMHDASSHQPHGKDDAGHDPHRH